MHNTQRSRLEAIDERLREEARIAHTNDVAEMLIAAADRVREAVRIGDWQ